MQCLLLLSLNFLFYLISSGFTGFKNLKRKEAPVQPLSGFKKIRNHILPHRKMSDDAINR
jgi:hypothetical protein